MKLPYVIAGWLLLTPLAMADGLPDLGDVSQTVLTPLQERAIGETAMREIQDSGMMVSDAEVVDYVSGLGYRLAANSPDNAQHFRFFALNDGTINAFAMPGGFIGVHTGLLLSAENESELASVLGHEIGHVVQHHMARMIAQQDRAMIPSLAAMALAILAARANPQMGTAGMMAAQAGMVQRQLDYTREHEREADRIGLQILNDSGFDARAMPAFFEILLKGTRFMDGSAPSFLRTHPLTTERIADVRNRVEQLPYRQVPDTLEFQLIRAKLRAGQGEARQTVAEMQQSLKDKRYSSETAQHYGLAVALMRVRDFAKARVELNWLRSNAPRHAMIDTLAANLEVAEGRPQQALSQFQNGLALFPTHRGLIYGCAELLLQMGRADEALKLAQDKVQTFPDDAYLYELQAQAYGKKGKQMLLHQAQGEAYFRQYDLGSAVEQFELAKKSNDGDFYQQSIVEARLNTLRQMLGDPKKQQQGRP